MKIKKGDTVKIICGKDLGKTVKILRVLPKKNKVVIEGLNLRIKHVRPRREREKGQRISFPAPMDVSNVMLVCPKCGKATRVGYKILEDKKKVRICKKCGEVI
jgi:large subunit ribosomal protein L24